MTPLAKQFITPLTLATLSKNPIMVEFFDPENGQWNSHVALGLWADAFVIAPATANTIAKMANGIADNLLLTTYLSSKCEIFVAPAMDLDMYAHPATQKNIDTLRCYRNHIIEPGDGFLASGLEGKGRMEEPENIAKYVIEFFEANGQKKTLKGKKIVVNAGSTREALDPVRFISNHSTGKMGYAIAHECSARGAEVTLVSGNSDQPIYDKNIKLIKVISALEMYQATKTSFMESDAGILSAAVADFVPESVCDHKIKKTGEKLTLTLVKGVDIAADLGNIKENRILVGFALETNNEYDNAVDKLNRKNFDFIVLNSLQDKGAGFGHNTNKISIFDKKSGRIDFDLKSKSEVAKDIVDRLEISLGIKNH